ncbi:MAG: HipA domain-containing protein [Proteobacteria bacterium]|nr:HipA domain-containing protein [Pseudomonadota bacterium]
MDFDIHLEGRWHPCASLDLLDGREQSRLGRVRLQYEADYAVEHLGAADHRALTVRAPVDLGTRDLRHWPSFLIDLIPQGAARKRIERANSGTMTDWALLGLGAINPVGNLRVRPNESRPQRQHVGFELQEMTARGDAFVDHAHELGATVAGATDTQGEAPKFWVVEDEKGRWHPDSGALYFPVRRYMLLKFPVPEAGEFAREILEHEARYQRVAMQVGLRVTQQLPEVVDGALLIPRFDRRFVRGVELRLGVESLYSITGVIDSATTAVRHHDILIALARCATKFEVELREYLRRDLLNIALGNRDNHGRNMAVLKDIDGSLQLTPLYDFGPSFLDARSIVRVIRWDGEAPDRRDWAHIMANVATYFEEAGVTFGKWAAVVDWMRAFADQIANLPAVMRECGVAPRIIQQRQDEIVRLARELREMKEMD